MLDYNHTQDREEFLALAIERMNQVNYLLSELTAEKKQLTDDIIAAIGHDHDGQETHVFDTWKVICKTPNRFKLDTKKYKNGDVYLEPEFNPIKETVSYKVDKKLYDHYFNTAPLKVREALLELITIEPGNKEVKIEPNLK